MSKDPIEFLKTINERGEQFISFIIKGKPATQGSKKWVGGHRIIDTCKSLPMWRAKVSNIARRLQRLYDFKEIMKPAAVAVEIYFFLQRPKSHLNKRGEVKESKPLFPVAKPDLLKMARAIEDSLSGILYEDDSQIVLERLNKFYTDFCPNLPADFEGAVVTVYPATLEKQ